jgi:hypothetical protein
MKKIAEAHYPLEPKVVLELLEKPKHDSFSRYLTFQNYTGHRKHMKVMFNHIDGLHWEGTSFPEGVDVLRSFVETGNRSYWDHLYFENRGGRTTLYIKHLKIIVRYNNPPGLSPDGLNHAEIPIVDWAIGMQLLAGHDEICLDEFSRRSRYAWARIQESDPLLIRMIAEDLGKSGSDGDGQDPYGKNPKYGGQIDKLCSEFVSWYYHENNITVNGKCLRDISGTQQLHDLFEAEGKLYRYNSESQPYAFLHKQTRECYAPKPGDFLERRGPDGAEHSMIIYRWLPGNPTASCELERLNRVIVFNGPWPVTLRLVRIHRDETHNNKNFWLGRID